MSVLLYDLFVFTDLPCAAACFRIDCCPIYFLKMLIILYPTKPSSFQKSFGGIYFVSESCAVIPVLRRLFNHGVGFSILLSSTKRRSLTNQTSSLVNPMRTWNFLLSLETLFATKFGFAFEYCVIRRIHWKYTIYGQRFGCCRQFHTFSRYECLKFTSTLL